MKNRVGFSTGGYDITPLTQGICTNLPHLRVWLVEFHLVRLQWCSDQRQPLQRPNLKGWRQMQCSWGTLFLRRWPESPGSACCTARLLQLTTICILSWCSPVACPHLRQLLSPGWPVRPRLGSTDKIKEVKEKDRAFALESVFAQGPSRRAVLS